MTEQCVTDWIDGRDGEQHRIVTAAFHRNGSGGNGFYVAIVESRGISAEEDGRFLCFDFTGDTAIEQGHTVEDIAERGIDPNGNYDSGNFGVLRMDDFFKSNLGMHMLHDPVTGVGIEGTGGNAWRGADEWGHYLRTPIRQWINQAHDKAREVENDGDQG